MTESTASYLCTQCSQILDESEIETHQCSFNEVVQNVTLTFEWPDDDIHKLLRIYNKHCSVFPRLRNLWNAVLREFNVTGKYSQSMIEHKLNELKTTAMQLGKDSVEYKQWPFAVAVSEMLRLEKFHSSMTKAKSVNVLKEATSEKRGVVQDAEIHPGDSNEAVRWTVPETMQVIDAYKRHVKELVQAVSNQSKRQVWEKISAEVKMSAPRVCNPYVARTKIENLKKTWRKQKDGGGRGYWSLYSEVSKLVKSEENVNRIMTDDECDELKEDIVDDNFNPSRKRKDTTEEYPAWFVQFKRDSQRRHNERIKKQYDMLEVLNNIADSVVGKN